MAHRIGIIAGSSPEAGIDLWRKVLDEHRAQLGVRDCSDRDEPEVLILSLPALGHARTSETTPEREAGRIWSHLRRAAEQLAPQVDVYLLAGASLYSFAEQLRALQLPAQLLTPADVTAAESAQRGIRGAARPAQTALPLLPAAVAPEVAKPLEVSQQLARAAIRWQPGTALEAPGALPAAPNPQPLPPVSILYTGGTFGMVASARGLVPDPNLDGEVATLLAPLQQQAESTAWTYATTVPSIDSAEVDPRTLGVLADRIRSLAAQQNARAVVVIHGTDTMAYSASFVAFALADLTVPVIFTGSQLPLRAAGSDAADNLRFAFRAASTETTPGVRIAFDGRLLPAVRATKRSSESFFGFTASRAIGADRLGLAPHTRAALRAAVGRTPPSIGLVKVSPGLSPAHLEAALAAHPAGLVLECYGAGTAPMLTSQLAAPIRAATERGSVVMVVTQCAHGAVELGRYAVAAELSDAGAVSGGDSTAEAALGKLAALTRAGLTGAALRAELQRNLIGERRG